MFLKKKRSGHIKGRGCADGRRQRLDIPKEEASSPTVTLESVFLTSLIDAAEDRDVATVDIPGAFLQADMDETVHMRFDGKMAELMSHVDPKLYRKFILNEHKKPVLYVKLRKSIYGTLRAALLFWTKLTQIIREMGFTINPYDEWKDKFVLK
jgi:Reverse transcriptase (RNA-dependent DNA polymerase)